MRLKVMALLCAGTALSTVSAYSEPILPSINGAPVSPPRKSNANTLPPRLAVPPDNSLWFRYYQAGENAMLKRDRDLEKKYLMASLGELEKYKKHPASPGDLMFLVKLSALEQNLEECYPSDWSKEKGDKDKILKLQAEQVSTLYRINGINDRFIAADDLMRIKSHERYLKVRSEYEKALADAKQSSDADKPQAQ